MHPYSKAFIVSAFSRRTLSLHGAFGRSKSSRENSLVHAHATLLRLLISCVSSSPLVTSPPVYRNLVVCAYFWPAALCTSDEGGGVGGSPFCGDFPGTHIMFLKAC
ncbi:unnamed protein product, partial [Sphacelaria rigidula]